MFARRNKAYSSLSIVNFPYTTVKSIKSPKGTTSTAVRRAQQTAPMMGALKQWPGGAATFRERHNGDGVAENKPLFL